MGTMAEGSFFFLTTYPAPNPARGMQVEVKKQMELIVLCDDTHQMFQQMCKRNQHVFYFQETSFVHQNIF